MARDYRSRFDLFGHVWPDVERRLVPGPLGEEMKALFTRLAERYERGSVMLTSNLTFSKWDQIFKDTMTTVAAIDWLVHRRVIIELNVPSCRIAKAKRATSRARSQPVSDTERTAF